MPSSSADEFATCVLQLEKTLRTVFRNRYKLTSHRLYGPKVRQGLVDLRRNFRMMKREYPENQFPAVAFQLAAIDPLVYKLIELYPSNVKGMLTLVEEISFKAQSDLSAELDATKTAEPAPVPFLPYELIEDRRRVLQKVLWEVNKCYNEDCYNACATMIRRLIETLIIEAFERKGLSDEIKCGGEYLKFGALIEKAKGQKELKLTRETKRVLPDLKFFGDLGAHNRMALVRKDDLDRLHTKTRVAVEELAGNL